MSNIPEIRNPLLRNGVDRDDRMEQSLDPTYAKVEERTESDFLAFAEAFSSAVQFYDLNDIPQGDWKAFFEQNIATENPQRALFIAFLRLLDFLHEHTNTLTQRHLDFYFRDLLEFTEENAKPSQAHIFFELAQNLERYLVEDGELFRAGTDEEGNNVLFKLVRDVVINNVQVAEMKTVFREDESFNNRLYAAPVANSKDGNGEPLDDDASGWQTFGQSQQRLSLDENFGSTVQSTMNDARVGFAIASPYFRLPEGNRKLTLTLHFENNLFVTPTEFLQSIQLSFSNEEEWIAVDDSSINITRSANKLRYELTLKQEDPSWDDYNAGKHGGRLDTIHPVLKFELKPDAPSYGYAVLKDLEITKYTIQTAVSGVRSLLLQNDYSRLDPTKPFLPFGAVPGVGDSLYVGHQEIFRHRIKEMRLNVNWKEVPNDDLGEQYLNYHPDILPNTNFNEAFKWTVDWLEDRQWKPTVNPQQQLFNGNATQEQVLDVQVDSNLDGGGFVRKHTERLIDNYDYSVPYGYLRLRLDGPNLPYFKGFGHLRYPIAVTKADANDEVQQPWSPEILSLTLDYKTEEEDVILTDAGVRSDRFFHLAPFGELEVHQQVQGGIRFNLLPQFDQEGYLYLGLTGVNAPESVPVLFQLAEGSGNTAIAPATTGVTWQYLNASGWKELSALSLSSDSTRSLLHSGIITFDLPSDVTTDNPLMPAGKVWLRARIPAFAEGIDQVEGIHAQAGLIEFEDRNNAANFLNDRLQPFTVSGLETSDTSVRGVTQPYSSFDGAPPEDENAFYTRVSERLRHKDRAIMISDYERLVMEQFDGIYKTKCLNHTNDVTELQAGAVRVVVVPDLLNHHARNRFQPQVGRRKLLDIEEFISARITPFIDLKVVNPLYEQIRLHFNVGFHPGFDAGYYGQQLHDELQHYLSPWAFEDGEDLVFGGKIYKSSLLKFIEDREYVDFVNAFTMFHIYCDDRQTEEYSLLLDTPNLAQYNALADHSTVRFLYDDALSRRLLVDLDVRFFKSTTDSISDYELTLHEDLQNLFASKDRKREEITLNYLRTMLKSFHYVEEVRSAKLAYLLPGNQIMEDVETAITKTSRSILVTAQQHRIAVYSAGDVQCEGNIQVGIGFMVVDADFYVD